MRHKHWGGPSILILLPVLLPFWVLSGVFSWLFRSHNRKVRYTKPRRKASRHITL